MTVLEDLLLAYSLAAFAYFAILNGLYLFLTALAWREMTHARRILASLCR